MIYVAWSARAGSRAGWIVTESGCHIWQGAKNRNGYGMAWDRSQRRQRVIHRIRYEREVGAIPAGMQLDHFACDNKACCNPLHVRPVTQRENILRGNGITSREAAQTHCKRGHPLSGDNLDRSTLRRGLARMSSVPKRTQQRERRLTWPAN